MNCSVPGQWSSKIGPVTSCSRSVTWFEFRYQGEWSDQSDNCDRSESQVYRKWSVISLSSCLVYLSQSQGLEVLLYTHSPESSRIIVNCSCDTEQGHEDTMMGSYHGGRVTACSIRCSILEYLMEMMVIFISPLGPVSLGGFPS
ncbi:hypothetical protein IGI04_030157, partial [Brassica rapa subsp. trilocularis]